MPVSFEFQQPPQQQQHPFIPPFIQNQFKAFQQKPDWIGNQNPPNNGFFPPSVQPPPQQQQQQQQSQVIPTVLHFQESEQPQPPKFENLRPMVDLFPAQQAQSSVIPEGGAPKAVIENDFEQNPNFPKPIISDIERPSELVISGAENANSNNGQSDNNNDNKNEKDEWPVAPPNFEEKQVQQQQQNPEQEFSLPAKATLKLEKDTDGQQQSSPTVNAPPLFFQVDDPTDQADQQQQQQSN